MKPNAYLIKSTLVGALGGVLFGFDTAVIAGTTRALTERFSLTPGSLGLTVSIALWGTMLGAMFAAVLGERLGPRSSLRVMAVLYVLSAIGCAAALNWPVLVVSRFAVGLAIGGSSVLAPMYIADISPAKWRGRLVSVFQFDIVLGILTAYLSNYLIGQLHLGAYEWRWMLGVAAFPAVLFFAMLYSIPESPRWLTKKHRIEHAREVLATIGEENPTAALSDIVASIGADVSHRSLTWRKYRRPIFLAVSIAMFNQLSGINAILYYLNDIFLAAGFSKSSGELQAVIVGLTFLVFTAIAMILIDTVGRKALLLCGSVGTALCLVGVAAIFISGQHKELLVWMLIGFIASFAISQGAVIWVYISEIFPNQVRIQGQALGTLTHWLMCAVISGVFPLMAVSFGGYPFLFFALMMVLQFFVVLFVFVETKGATIEEIERQLAIADVGVVTTVKTAQEMTDDTLHTPGTERGEAC